MLLAAGALVSTMWLVSRGWFALVVTALVVGWFVLWESVLVQRASAGVIIVVGLVLRVVWLALVPTEPAVDFATYHAFAARLASGVSNEILFAAMPLQEVGYPLFLGGVYTLVGVSVVAGRAVNVLLALWLMMAVRRLLLPQGEQVTRTGLMLVALWPANLAMTSLLASENLFLPLMWTGLVFVGAQPLRGGLLLGVAQAVRPTAVVLLLVLTLRREWRWVIALWLGVALAFGGYRVLRSVAGDSVTRGAAAFSLLVGSNRESLGAWNIADQRWFAAKADEQGPEVAAAAARAKALERLTSAPVEWVVLMARKFHAQWGNGAVAMTFAMAEPGAPVLAWADAWALSLWALALWRVLKGPGFTELERWAGAGLGVAVVSHLLLEANARYALPWMVGVLLLAAAAPPLTRRP